MAAPTITWYKYTDAGPTETQITVLDYGNVQAGDWSDALVIRALFSGSANSLRFWLYDTTADNNGSSVNVGNANGWIHNYTIYDTYLNPSTIDDNVKSGSTPDANGQTWGQMPESQPADSSDWVNSSVGDQGAGTGGYTDYIFHTNDGSVRYYDAHIPSRYGNYYIDTNVNTYSGGIGVV